MNVLQITNGECASMLANDNTGINRAVSALCSYFTDSCGYKCFNAYYRKNPSGLSKAFSNSLKLMVPLSEEEFRTFLIDEKIDVIVINVSDAVFVKEIPKISLIAHQCNVKTIYCIHFMPGYESYSYTDFSFFLYNLTHKAKVLDSLKKWFMNISRPLSSRIIHKILQRKYKMPLETCDKVVVFTHPYVRRYLDVAHSMSRKKFAVIPNPLPFKSNIAKNELLKKEKEVIIVGRLYEPQKRLSFALRVWREIEKNHSLNDWKLTIVGMGTSRGYYEYLIRKYKLKRVSLEGSRNPEPYYRRAPILLSTSAYEGWPMVLMECMPMGVIPCVFNSYEATSEIIDHNQNGIVSPDNDIKSFYTYLKDLMLNPSRRLQMAKSAIEKAKSFDINIIGNHWSTLFDELNKNFLGRLHTES